MQSRKLLTILPLMLLLLLASCMLASCDRDPKAQAQRLVDQGNKFFKMAKYKEASIMYRRAYSKDLRFGEAYYRLGLTEMKLGNYSEAVRMLRRAVDLQPNNVDAITKLADIMLVASSQDRAHSAQLLKDSQDLVDKLIKLDPHSYDGHRILGEMALLQRKPADAIKELSEANQVQPYQPDVVLTYFQALVQNDQFPEAEKLARELIARQPDYAPMYNVLYLQYMRMKRPDDAQKVLELKVDKNPTHANYLMELVGFHYIIPNHRPEMDAVIQRVTDEKKFPEGHLLAGDFFFFRAREYDHAQQQYEAGMKAFPKEKALYQKRMVELYATTNHKSEANGLLADILKANPKDNDAIAMRAALMLTTGDRDQINIAANDLQALVSRTPNNHLLQFNLARALIAKGDIEGGRLHLEEAVKLRSDFIAAREILARIYLSKGDAAKALQASEQILQFDRGNLQAHLTRSSALLALKDTGKARDELDYIAKAYPQNPEARYQVGYLALQDKDYKKATTVFGSLYKDNPRDRRGLVGVTETMIAEGHINDAIKETEKAIQIEPERRDLKLFLANQLKRAERYKDAIAIYQTLLDKEPKSADLLFKLAETQRLIGDVNPSMENFRKCSQAAPADTTCLTMLAMELQGTGRDDQAKPVYEQILKIQPTAPIALNNLAYIKAQEGVDLDQAFTMAQRAVQQAPQALDLSDTLGWICIKKNLTEQAIRIFSDLTTKDPNNATFHFHYGMALEQKGDRPGAKREFDLALKHNPSKAEDQKIHEEIQKIGP
jgi:tetratricopeptide (TPR) repeat protein